MEYVSLQIKPLLTHCFVSCWIHYVLRHKQSELRKWEREKQILYINAYMWNLEKWYKWTYLQSRNRDTEVENKHMDTKEGKEGWDELGNWDWHLYTTIYKLDNQWEPTA